VPAPGNFGHGAAVVSNREEGVFLQERRRDGDREIVDRAGLHVIVVSDLEVPQQIGHRDHTIRHDALVDRVRDLDVARGLVCQQVRRRKCLRCRSVRHA
jgi:hypothetical protein